MTRRVESTLKRVVEQGRVRLMLTGLCFLLCYSSIAVRMIEVAVSGHAERTTITVSGVDGEGEEKVDVSPKVQLARGDIVDRNGVLLATSLTTASLYANPKEVRHPEETAKALEKLLRVDKAQLLKRLKTDKSFVWLKRNLTPAEQMAANSLGIPGLYFSPEEKRIYPYGNVFAHALGYVGLDNKGLAGLEKQFDARLRDGAQNRTPLALALDARLQFILHDETKAAMDEFQAIGAMGVVMDVKTGEILSMVSLPDFDPHAPSKAPDAAKFNRVTLGTYEMGSTFKSFTMAMALDKGTVTMKGGYDATNPLKIANFTIKDDHAKKRWLSVPEIYAYSSNIGTAKMLLDAGIPAQKAFMKKIGMLQPVPLEFPERAAPSYPKDWRDISAVTISYGHGISVTPLHLVRGIAALVGGGVLPRMTLLKDGGGEHASNERVISKDTSHNMSRLMRLVVEYGTASKADVPGYRVGGKTGTAEKITAGGGYSTHANISSLIATFPVDDPQYVVLVMMDEPKGTKESFGFVTGGWVAAPAVGRVIERMGPILGITPVINAPGDDANRFWPNTDKPKIQEVKAPWMNPHFVQNASY